MSEFESVDLAFKSFEPKIIGNERNPVVIMHGLTASTESWSNIPQIIADETGRKVYTVDARNHGDSPWSKEFHMGHNTVDILRFLDTIKAKKAVLIGHSMGGIAVMKVALKAPQKVEAIVVEDMKVHTEEESKDTRSLSLLIMFCKIAPKAVEEVPAGSDEQTSRNFIQDYIMNAIPPELRSMVSPDSTANRLTLKQNSDGRWVFKANLAAILERLSSNEPIVHEYSGVFDKPACFIYGTISPLKVEEGADQIRQFFPKAELVPITGAGHLVHNERPEEFVQQTLKFLHSV